MGASATDKKITDLTAATGASGTDLLVTVQNMATTPVTKKITVDTLIRDLPSTGIIIGDDTNLYRDSANVLKTDDSFSTVGKITSGSRLESGGVFTLGAPTTLSLSAASGSIVMTKSYHLVDTYNGTDTTGSLGAIHGGATGDILIIRPASTSRTIVVEDTAWIATNSRFVMDNSLDNMVLLCYSAGYWMELSRSDNGA